MRQMKQQAARNTREYPEHHGFCAHNVERPWENFPARRHRLHQFPVSPKTRSLPTQGGGVDGGDGDWSDDGHSTGEEHDRDSWDEPPRGRSRKRRWEALERDGEVPSLSTSFASTTQSRIASGQSRQASRPLTPKEGENNASLASAGDTTGSQKPPKRIHIEELGVES